MSAPVTPDQLKALLPNTTGNQCDSFLKALITFPTKIWQLFSWLLDSAGDLNDNIVRYVLKPGDLIFSAGILNTTGRLLCDGSAVVRTTYPELFAAIGTIYGAGDGTTTFNLPDYRARFPVGQGTGKVTVDSVETVIGSYALGDIGGEKEHTLLETEMPAHHHHDWLTAGNGVKAGADYVQSAAGGSTGGGQPHENRPPYIACYIYIKT